MTSDGIRYESISVVDLPSGKRGHWFVPRVVWECGHFGFIPNYMDAGESKCPQCGASFQYLDMNENPKPNAS